MSPPTKELMKLTLEGKLAHGGHPVLRWMIDNVPIRSDPAGNIKADKERSTEKIMCFHVVAVLHPNSSILIRRINKRINLHGATPHFLRHTFLTLASNSGIEPKMIQALAGHADISITLNRYVHAQIEPIKRASATLAEKINSLETLLEHANGPQSLAT